jgi:hypothetical protein
MIQRLVTTLRALAELSPGGLETSEGKRLAGDCADALRLELDCPQRELTAEQRRILVRLNELLESETDEEEQIRTAARSAYTVIRSHSKDGAT